MARFVPKQCLPPDLAFFTQISGDTTEQVARHLLDFIPPIPPGSIIHDNACGSGAMTVALMEAHTKNIVIHATDKVPSLIDTMSKKATSLSWPVLAEVMLSEALSFPPAKFTHSFTNFAIMLIKEDAAVAEGIHRTLRDGGVAVLSIWDAPLPVQVVKAAHEFLRSGQSALPPAIARGSFNAEDLRSLLEGVGFTSRGLSFGRTKAVLEVADLRFWATAVWSFLGCPQNGWIAQDEQRWDEVIDFIVDWVQNWENYRKLDSGAVRLDMEAHVVVAWK
ncbi:S-adenosyl-L-methionine-dependent methyltransferase [Karstenula rhodostoma CBS 690.94]|uniref:S-adenosyl-L-methionine-dependent methyltransferase n=1 Tax=Karstenula rhodostoma CBS 690.94 TaxID=1392251 RepID=A0A9P4PNU5_9PLEO|nr:S-adenosyl-L-methionine-dependent methyltransferase [Karstenula rhodostoma CBS 690.94]